MIFVYKDIDTGNETYLLGGGLFFTTRRWPLSIDVFMSALSKRNDMTLGLSETFLFKKTTNIDEIFGYIRSNSKLSIFESKYDY